MARESVLCYTVLGAPGRKNIFLKNSEENMNQKELNEIRRRLAFDKNNIRKIYGCFVGSTGTIISRLEEPLAPMPQPEAEKYLALFKKTLSGSLGRNLIELSFSTKQVMEGDEHRLLTDLRKSDLSEEEKREALYEKIIKTVRFEDSNYVILLAEETYDVPYKGTDGIMQEDSSESMFKYFICSVCPVSESKTELGYVTGDNSFHNCVFPQTVSAPELGFMFPLFDDRAANIYGAMMYTRDAGNAHQEFVDEVFSIEPPMPAKEQEEAFKSVLAEALEEDCSFDLLQSVHEQIRERIEEHKESRDPEPLSFSRREVGEMLKNGGASESRVESFNERCREHFGEDSALNPKNIVNSKKFELETPNVKISVSPEASYMVETKIINGRKYILIPADEGVLINGVNIKITED